jgi:hypothetical protein
MSTVLSISLGWLCPARGSAPAALTIAKAENGAGLCGRFAAFHLPREQAAEYLHVTVNELKKALKQLGVARW